MHKWYLEVLVATPVARRERRWSMEFEESGREIVGIKLLSLLYLRSTFETLTLRKCLKTVEMIKYPVSKLEMRGECIASRNLKMFFFKLLSFYFVFVIVRGCSLMTSSPEGEGGISQKMTNDDMMTKSSLPSL